MVETKLEGLNQRELRKLMLSIRASAERLDLLLAICDDRNLQAQLIHTYETELRQQGITPYQIRLDSRQPSLRATLADLVERTPTLQTGERAVVTVLGGNELLGVKLTDTPSEQDQFFFSLQWTREALRGFHFPIVLWLSDRIATRLSQQAPDFWSWRSGVFEFVAPTQAPNPGDQEMLRTLSDTPETDTPSRPINDLTAEIASIEQQNPESPLLITLHSNLGAAYEQRYDYDLALQSYERALKLAQTHKDRAAEAQALRNIGNALYGCSRYLQAIEFYEQSLAIYREIGDSPEERQSQSNGEGKSLSGLGNAYFSLGQYQQAIAFHEQSLAIRREISDHRGEAASLNNLGGTYYSLGQYQQAIAFYEQSLAIFREIGDSPGERQSQRNGEATALGNLGSAYYSLGQYQQAIAFYEQSLAIQREIGDRNGEASILGNVGAVYNSLGQYQQAIAFHEQSLAIQREIGDRNGEASVLGNLGNAYNSLGQYQQAIALLEQSLAIKHESGDRNGEADSLYNLGMTLARVDRHFEARQHFEQALALYEDLKLPHRIEQCKDMIYRCSQIIPMQRRVAPAIEPAPPAVPDWWEKSQPTPQQPKKTEPASRGQSWGMWFAVGLGVVLLVWWLKSR